MTIKLEVGKGMIKRNVVIEIMGKGCVLTYDVRIDMQTGKRRQKKRTFKTQEEVGEFISNLKNLT